MSIKAMYNRQDQEIERKNDEYWETWMDIGASISASMCLALIILSILGTASSRELSVKQAAANSALGAGGVYACIWSRSPKTKARVRARRRNKQQTEEE